MDLMTSYEALDKWMGEGDGRRGGTRIERSMGTHMAISFMIVVK
jgi:hypothetical protein